MATQLRVVCPSCLKHSAVPVKHAGKRGRCPFCSASVAIPQPTAANTFDPTPKATPPPDDPPRRSFAEAAAAVQQPPPEPEPEPEPELPHIVTTPRHVATTTRYQRQPTPRGWSNFTARSFRHWAPVAISCGPLLVAALFIAFVTVPTADIVSAIILGIAAVVLWFVWVPVAWFIREPITNAILCSCMPTASCPRCRERHTLVDTWSCACGYNDHRERHFYAFKCANCSSRPGHFNCPRCDATILL